MSLLNKCQADELLIMQKHMKSYFNDILNQSKTTIQNLQNQHKMEINEFKEKLDKNVELKVEQHKTQLLDEIEEQSERCKCKLY